MRRRGGGAARATAAWVAIHSSCLRTIEEAEAAARGSLLFHSSLMAARTGRADGDGISVQCRAGGPQRGTARRAVVYRKPNEYRYIHKRCPFRLYFCVAKSQDMRAVSVRLAAGRPGLAACTRVARARLHSLRPQPPLRALVHLPPVCTSGVALRAAAAQRERRARRATASAAAGAEHNSADAADEDAPLLPPPTLWSVPWGPGMTLATLATVEQALARAR